MKYLFIVIALLVYTQTAISQIGIRTGFKLGRTQSKFTGDDFKNIDKLKANSGGLSLELGFLVFAVQADLLYQSKGTVLENGDEIKLNYISIPVLIKKRFLPMLIHPYIMVGPEWNYHISGDIKIDGVKTKVEKTAMAAVVGVGIEFELLGKGAFLEGRYHFGLSSISKIDNIDIKDKTASIYFGVLL
ncbi:PorT family protein [bacterium]|nr:PorT family protein [bacterium]